MGRVNEPSEQQPDPVDRSTDPGDRSTDPGDRSTDPVDRSTDPIARLRALGLELPRTPTPIANYLPAARWGDLVYVAGHGSIAESGEAYIGRVGAEYSLEQGQQAARLAALNCLAALNSVVPLASVRQIVKVTGFIHSTDGFTQQPEVLNGASDLLVAVFGQKGKHARTAVGLRQTARSYTVQMELIAAVETTAPSN